MRDERSTFVVALLAAGLASSCFVDGDVGVRRSALTKAQRRARAAEIRDAASAVGISAGWALAGIADAETRMSHCWSELQWACRGPSSPDCGGGPVVAGAGDGPCSIRQGGLGMFQFDGGTFEQTLRRDGDRVLRLGGNVEAAVEFVLDMIVRSPYVAGIGSRDQARAWLNGLRVDNDRFRPWVQTVTHLYNGCAPSYRCYSQRFAHYRDHAQKLWAEMGGGAFWDAAAGAAPAPDLPVLRAYWTLTRDGQHRFRTIGGSAERVSYAVDRFELGDALRENTLSFAYGYEFNTPGPMRRLTVRGFDETDREIARGVHFLDVGQETDVYVRQLGDRLYEIGLEPDVDTDGVEYLQVFAGEFALEDIVSGQARSPRLAVLYRFHDLGTRDLRIRMLDADRQRVGRELRRRVELR